MHFLWGIAVLIFLCNNSIAQTAVIDSLNKELEHTYAIEKKIEIYVALGKEYYSVDPEISYFWTKSARGLAEKVHNNKYSGKIFTYLGMHAIRNDSLDLAIVLFSNAIDNIEEKDEPDLLIMAYLNLANTYLQKDNYPEALNYYHQAIDISDESGYKTNLPNLFNNLGIAELNMKNYEKALELFTKALQGFESNSDSTNIAGTTANIGSIYTDLEEYELASEYYTHAYDIFKKINNTEGEAHALFKLGLLNIMRKNYGEALDLLNQSLEIQDQLEVTTAGSKTIFLAETLINKGIIYLNLGQIDMAIQDLRKGLELSQESGQLSLIALATQNLSDAYSQSGHKDTALDYYKMYKQYSDSTFNEEKIRRITQIEMQNQFNDKIKEQKLDELKQKRKDLIYIIILVCLVFILVLFVLLLRLEKSKKKKVELERRQLKNELDFRNKELATHVLYNLKKSEFIINISEKLKKIRLQEVSQNKKLIDEILSEMKTSARTDEWKEFEIRFQNVYTGFYKKLSSKFPDLTPNELRLCAFLRLNMTTKDIAAITQQSYSSIDIARYRLRKKMGLEKDENLIAYLTKF